MSGFNPLHIITRIANNVIASVAVQNNGAKGAQNSSLNTGAPGTFSQNLQPQSTNNTPMFFKSVPVSLSLTSEQKLTTIAIEQKASYAKDLLNLPRDFSELINQITSGTDSLNPLNKQMAERLKALLQNGKIDLSSLSALLGENSKYAAQKLMMTIANVAKYGANDVSALKDMMSLFSTSSAFATENQALKTLMLLYLPWLPLSSRNENNLDFTIDIFDKIDGPDPDSEEPSEVVKILIETNNFSNITVLLEMNGLGQVDVDVAAPENFPHKKVIELIKEEASLNNIKSNVSSGASKNASEAGTVSAVQAGQNDGKTQELQYSGNVKIAATGAISPKLMIMTQSLIKIIIQVDYEENIIKNNLDGDKTEGEV